MTTQPTLSVNDHKSIAGKYLTFTLGAECYGVAVLKVREIIKLTPITSVPHMPAHVKGVINLRGKIIPVLDLRMKFGMDRGEYTDQTCIIVVQVAGSVQAVRAFGVIVDSVEEVTQIATQDIEDTPDFGSSVDRAYMLGMAKIKGSVKILLDIEGLFGGDALVSM